MSQPSSNEQKESARAQIIVLLIACCCLGCVVAVALKSFTAGIATFVGLFFLVLVIGAKIEEQGTKIVQKLEELDSRHHPQPPSAP
jgi:Flp pilus assembly protein TadB